MGATTRFKVTMTDTQLVKAKKVIKKDYVNGVSLAKMTGRIDKSAATDTYYIQIFNTTTNADNLVDGLFANSDATLLIAPIEIEHVNGVSSTFDVDVINRFVHANKGLTVAVSTTEFTLTQVGSDMMNITILTD